MDEFSKQLHKPKRKKFERRKINASFVGDIVELDLVDMSALKSENDGVTFLLNCIDVYSRFVWSFPLLNKSAKHVLEQFKKIPIKIKNVFTDRGKEFFNQEFEKYCKDNDINHYSTFSEIKCPHVERFNRTLKTKMYKYFDLKQTIKYVDVLQDLVKNYNNTKHTSIKQKPADVLTKEKEPEEKKRKLKANEKINIGDYVRISRLKKTFEKGYTQNWSEEVFKVINIDRNSLPLMYEIEDLQGEELKGKFYAQELQTIDEKFKDFALIEKVLKRKGNKVYVKYKGYDNKFNEWIDKRQTESLINKD